MTSSEIAGYGPHATLTFPARDVFALGDRRYPIDGDRVACKSGRLRLRNDGKGYTDVGPTHHYRSVWLARATDGSLVVEMEDIVRALVLLIPARERRVEWYRFPVAPE